MNKMICGLLLILFCACQGKSDQEETGVESPVAIDVQKELDAIDQLRSEFSLAIKEGRYEDMGKYVSANVKTVRPAGASWDAMFALGQARGRFPYDSIVMSPAETYVLNDTIAYDWGTSKVYYTDEEGEMVELRNSFLVILKKEDGQWKLHREVGSSVVD